MRLPVIAESLRSLFKRVPDTEAEQATIRAVFCPLVAALYMYSIPDRAGQRAINHHLLYLMVLLYAIAAAAVLGALFVNPAPSQRRRIASLLVDAATVTATMLVTFEYGVAFFGFFMWICLGYGLRYGAAFLRLAQAVTVVGFLLVIAFSPYWHDHLQIGLGLLVTMFYVPPLASLVLERARKARAEAEEANKAKSRFVANISHEIRTPLNAIIGYADLLGRSKLDSEQQLWMTSVTSSASLLLSLVNNVLDLSRIEAGKATIARNRFRLQELLDSVQDVLGPQAEEKGLYLEVDKPPAGAEELVGDRDHLAQVLINLVSNAIKFTHRGGVMLRIDVIAESPSEVELAFRIVDTGIGIAAADTRHIFESFAQADEATRRRYGGTGLGTTIAKELVERMGGRIGVESTPKRGSTFWFHLRFGRVDGAPIPLNPSPGRALPAPAVSLTAVPPLEPRRILVVEDNAMNQTVVARILEHAGYEVDCADCAAAAVVRVACERYDLMLLDLELPAASGLELLTRLREKLDYDVPAIMLTANATREAQARCIAAGARVFLTKPTNPGTLLTCVTETLEATPKALPGMPSRGVVSAERLEQKLAFGGEDLVLELIGLWRQQCPADLSKLEDALHQNDREQVRHQLHRLEGSAGELGAQLVLDACQQLRSSVLDSPAPARMASMDQIRRAYREASAVFEKLEVLVRGVSPHVQAETL